MVGSSAGARAELWDTGLGTLLGGAVNVAMLLLAAAAFGGTGLALSQTHSALSAVLPAAGQLFGLGLLVAGVASAVTSSLCEASTTAGLFGAGVSSRRPLFRLGLLLAIVPAIAAIGRAGHPLDLLVWSQVVLTLQLPFTLAALIWFSRDARLLGTRRLRSVPFALAALLMVAIVLLNAAFLLHQFGSF